MNAVLPLSIGAASKRTGCTVPTIRYYEEIGLLPPAPRTDGNQRHYDDAALRRLGFIRRCRDLGFTLDQVRELVGLMDRPDRDCVEVREVAQVHLANVEARIAELQAVQAALGRFVRSCSDACAGGPVVDCTILESLGTPAPAGGPAEPAPARPCCA